MDNKYTFCLLDENDYEKFIGAWELAFSRELDSQVYEWVFSGNLIYVALHEGEIAAGYCLYPLKAMLDGTMSTALLCNNVFVSPKHQGQRLFVKLGIFALEDVAAKGYSLAYGLPNENALPGHLRVGWEVLPHIGFYEKKCIHNPSVTSVVWVEGSLNEKQRKDIEICSMAASAGRSFSILKTREFVKWRYEDKPGVNYWFGLEYSGDSISAYSVCKYYSETNTLHFIDIDGVDDDAVRRVIVAARNISTPYDKINVWESTCHAKVFESLGYSLLKNGNDFIVIQPTEMKGKPFQGGVNLVLGDNDVY